MFFDNLLFLAPDLLLWGAVALLAWPHERTAEGRAAPSLISLVAIVAIAHLPLGLSAPLKFGGGLNSLHTLHYLAAAIALAVGVWLKNAQAVDTGGRGRLLLGALWCCGIGMAHAHGLRCDANWTLARDQEKLLSIAEQHRGRIYLPWNPLITILTEDKIYPFDNALLCLEIAGMPLPASVVRATIPPNSLILFPKFTQSARVLDYLGSANSPPSPIANP